MTVDGSHLFLQFVSESDNDAEGLVERVENNTKRYLHLLADIADEIMPTPTEAAEPDVADILAHHVRPNFTPP